MPDDGNGFKLKTVEDIAKLQAAVEIGHERTTLQLEIIKKDVKELAELVRNIKQPCSMLEEHINEHKSSNMIDWIKKKPIQATLIGLFIVSQLGISLDKLVEIVTGLIK